MEIEVIINMDNQYYIYCYINKINNKKYIGQTKMSQAERAGHLGRRYQGCPRFWAAIQKYGWNNFDYQILKEYHWKFIISNN